MRIKQMLLAVCVVGFLSVSVSPAATQQLSPCNNTRLPSLTARLVASDTDLLSESYDIQVAKYMMKGPLTTAGAVRSVLDELGERNPKAREQDPGKFFDDRFVRQLQGSDFIDSLYR